MSGPDVWGPHGWKFIHYITLGYPYNPTESEKLEYKKFFSLLGSVIPCSICGNNYIEHLKIKPLTDNVLSNKQKFIEWGIDMHNLVNMENNKQIITYEDGMKKILDCSNDCKYVEHIENMDNSKNFSNFIYIIVISILICIILFLIINK